MLSFQITTLLIILGSGAIAGLLCFKGYLRAVTAIAAIVIAGIWLSRWSQFIINPTSSLPRGVYRYTHEPLHRGVMISFPQPHKPGVRMLDIYPAKNLMKYLAAMPGDVVFVNPMAIFVNGQRWPNSQAPDPPDTLDHRCLGHHVVQPGHVWAFGTNILSFDSRYFCDIELSSINATAQPMPLFGIPDKELCNDEGPSPSPCYLRPGFGTKP